MISRSSKAAWRFAIGAAFVALVPGMAHAQSDTSGSEEGVNNPQEDEVTSEAIVVTGTLIRGIAPAGNNVVGLSEQQIASTGAATTSQVLASVPQVGNFFNALPAGVSPQACANASNPVNRPNLRNLPGANTSGGAQTLVLFDGQRVVGAGIQQVAVDPDIIAPGVIARVEAMTDGGSAVYGSDALGGVINFITRDKFDGLDANVRYPAPHHQRLDLRVPESYILYTEGGFGLRRTADSARRRRQRHALPERAEPVGLGPL